MFQKLRNAERQNIINHMKGNDGQSARRRRQRRFMGYFILLLTVYVTTTTIYYRHFAGMFVPDVEIDKNTGEKKIRRRPKRHYQKLNPNQKTTPLDAVLEGFMTLIDIHVSYTSLQGGSGSKTYSDVVAMFCHIDWELQQKNPSTVPMFRDLKDQSKMCDGTILKVDLLEATEKAKAYDAKFGVDAVSAKKKGKKDAMLPIPEPTGVVFHETRCGSTLTANLLASFDPEHSRVYSESPPPVTALKACDIGIPCDPQKHTKLIQDVFYLMGRTSRIDRPQFVFYKIQSIGAMAIDKFTMAFPNTPWVFIYRDSIEVMMSYFKTGVLGDNSVCTRNYGKQMNRQPKTVQQIFQQHGQTSMEAVEKTDYCAAHLAGLSLSALNEHSRTGKGNFVNYNQLPDAAWTKILPKFFGVQPISDAMISNMKQVAGVYSKGRNKKANQEWAEDSTRKQNMAPEPVVKAANAYLKDVYEQMETLSSK